MNLARRYPTGVAATLPVRAKLPARAKARILPTTSAWTAPARRRSRCDHRARRTHRGHRVGVGYNALHRPARRPAAREDQPHPGDRAGERGLRRHVRTRLPGRLPERHTPPQGRAAPELLRHRARQSRQLHRPGLRPGADGGHPGRLRGQRLCLRQRHSRHARCRPGASTPGRWTVQGCVYPATVPTIAAQLDAKYPPNPTSHVAAWRAYEQDMGNTPSRDGESPDPDRWHGLRAPRHRGHGHGRSGHARGPVHVSAQPVRVVPLGDRRHGGMRRQCGPARDPGPQRDPFAHGPSGTGPPQREHHAALRLRHPQPVRRRPRRNLRGAEQRGRPSGRPDRCGRLPASMDAARPRLARVQAR